MSELRDILMWCALCLGGYAAVIWVVHHAT